MSKRINVAEINRAIREVRLGELEEHFQKVEQRIIDVTNVDSYQGRTASAMKSYLREVHGLVVRSFLIVIMQTESGIRRFMNGIGDIDASERAILDEGYLSHLQGVARSYEIDMRGLHEDFAAEVRRANQVMNLSGSNLERLRTELDDEIHQSALLIERTMDDMDTFDEYHMNEIESLNSHVRSLENVLNQIDGIKAGGIDNFRPGSVANSPLGKDLLNHMAKSAIALAQVGSTDALALLGGYINTLPADIRKLYEGLKGKAKHCAMVGDPVNAVTGNFIYDYVDVKVEGRYPIEFRRFYNSLDAITSTLGRNWTHSFDIRLIPLEDYGISVIYGDSRQEHYSQPVKEDINTYISGAGNFNVLRKVREEGKITGCELIFVDGSKYIFNSEGRFTKQLDSAGNEVKLSYEEDQLIKIESPSGYLELTYKGEYIEKITDHTGREISYEYENNLLSTYTNALGNSYSYEYDLRERLVNVINPEGNLFVENVYDDQDRVTKQIFADGSEMSYKYKGFSEHSKSTEFTKQNGSKFIYKRDAKYRTTGIVEPDGKIAIEYNGNSQRSKYIDKLGNETSFEYDERDNVTKVTNALGVITELEYVEGTSKMTSVVIDGNQKISSSYDDSGNLVSVKDALNNETAISYRKNNLPEVITQADGSQINLTYDGRHNIIQVEDASGVVTEYQYNALNQVISAVDGNKNETSFRYDDQNNIIEVNNAEGNRQNYTYNKQNKVVEASDFNNAKIQREYNELGKLSKATDPLGRETLLDYDCMWNIAKVTSANGAETEFLYNEMNRLETVVKPDSSKVSYEYDPNGNRTKVIDEEGNETHLSYNVLDQLIEVSGEDGLKFSYTYNVEGQVTAVTNGLDNTVNLEYNVLGQLIKETNALGDSRTYTYTSLGKVATVTDEAGRVTSYEYELGGRLKSISHPGNTSEIFTYDPVGNVKTHISAMGQTATYNS